MTNPTLSCEQFADMLADFLERDVDDTTRARMEAHALSCDECGPLLADLRSLRINAANLPELAPSRDLWPGIAERIEAQVVEICVGGTNGKVEAWNGGRPRIAPFWYGLAAAGLVAVTATVTHELTKRSMTPASPTVVAAKPVSSGDTAVKPPISAATQLAASRDSIPPVRSGALSTAPSVGTPTRLVSTKPTAEQTYDAEIARLRVVVNRRRGQLDSATVATIEKNLTVIDQAIAQCKQALQKDPASRFLMESLNDAMDDKVQLLRTAASLPTRM